MQNSVGQYQQQPQAQSQPPVQGTIVQSNPIVPNAQSGVHIQIFNPSVGTPGAQPVYNVNAPAYGTNPYTTSNCYPSNYYTQQWGQGCCNPQYNTNKPNSIPHGQQMTNGQTSYPQNGVSEQSTENNPIPGSSPQNTYNQPVQNNINNNTTNNSEKETEKRTIVLLTDDYIKNVENYLNSQDKEVRLMGAKEVAARAMEDPSRRDDKALNALVNKMIQDPDIKVRFIGLSLLYSRTITGDAYTEKVLENMQHSTSGYGQDALMASNILLKMSGQTAEKEFEVTSKDKKKKQMEDVNKVMTIL